jgi:alkylmercury lyase
MADDLQRLSERLGRSLDSAGGASQWWFAPLLRLLARGEPVTVADLAAAAGRPEADVQQALAARPDTEFDEQGRIVGYGLTLRPTPHRFEVDGRTLYTWCALDTLIFPALLGRTARITSPCHATGTPVRVTAGPGGVAGVDPALAVVSVVTPQHAAAVREAFCNQVHFFASRQAAGPWLAAHPGGSVVTVADAYRLGRPLAGAAAGPSGCR